MTAADFHKGLITTSETQNCRAVNPNSLAFIGSARERAIPPPAMRAGLSLTTVDLGGAGRGSDSGL